MPHGTDNTNLHFHGLSIPPHLFDPFPADKLDIPERALPKVLDEKVARLHLPALGAELTVLTKEQADYIDVPVGGPYKPDTYRY